MAARINLVGGFLDAGKTTLLWESARKISESGKRVGLHESAAYIFRKQLEEADLILISKKDWLDEVTTRSDSGTHLAEVDYDTYAEGEAVLGWLNAAFKLNGKNVDWDAFASRFIHSLGVRFESDGSSVGHVKLLLRSGKDYAIGNLTGKSETVRLRGNAGFGDEAELTVNARVQMEPAALEAIIMAELADSCGRDISHEVLASNCLSPGRPNPTYRYDYTV